MTTPIGTWPQDEHYDPALIQVLREINAGLREIKEKEDIIMAAIDDLTAADTSLQAKVSQVLTDFAAALAAAQGDPAKVEQVATDMNNMAAQLTAADPATPAPAPAG